MKENCMKCGAEMKPSASNYKGIKLDSLQCPRCKTKIFTEELSIKAIEKVQSARLEKEYEKQVIHIGNSLGLTFPKDVAEVFGLEGKKIVLRPNVGKKVIEIGVE